LGKQLELADKKGIRKSVIIGEKELQKGIVTVRNMKTGEQILIKRTELISFLR